MATSFLESRIYSDYNGELWGLEIELEGRGPFWQHDDLCSKYWGRVRDGSLQGLDSVEFVLHHPCNFKDAQAAVVALYKEFHDKGVRVSRSMRAGTHVHLNFGGCTVQEVCTFITLYYILEIPLTNICGPDRVGNLFCMRLCDAEAPLMALHQGLKSDTLRTLSEEHRSAALNLLALRHRGTLEFRALESPLSPEPLLRWMALLQALREAAKSFQSPLEVVTAFSAEGGRALTEQLLGGDLAAPLLEQEDFLRKINEGIWHTQSFVYETNWVNKATRH